MSTGAKDPESLEIEIGTDGRIAWVGPALAVGESHQKIELGGKLVVAGLVDMHQHLDKSRTRRLVQNPTGDIPGAPCGLSGLRGDCDQRRHPGSRCAYA